MRHILSLLAVIASYHCLAADGTIYHPIPRQLCDSTVMFDLPIVDGRVEIEARAAMTSGRTKGKEPGWCIVMADGRDTVRVGLSFHTSDRFSIYENRSGTISVTRGDAAIAEFTVDEDTYGSTRNEYNTLILALDGQQLSVSGGQRVPVAAGSCDLGFMPTSAGVGATGCLDLKTFFTTSEQRPETRLASGNDLESIIARIESPAAPHEAMWSYLDRENDNRYALPGGRYTVALLADGKGGYDIVYMSGAKVNANRWNPGMIKGHLTPTVFKDHFDLQWYDAEFNLHDTDTHASITDEGYILTLSFPLLKTQIRLSRHPQQP